MNTNQQVRYRTARGYAVQPAAPHRPAGRRKKKQRHRALVFLLVVLMVAATAAALLKNSGFFARSARKIKAALPESIAAGTQAAEQKIFSNDTLQELQEMLGEYPEIEQILSNPDRYPDSLLQLLARNPETLEFVLGYTDETARPPEDISQELRQGEIPSFFQWDARWGYSLYGDDMMAVTGCGPTCLSMVASGLTGDARYTPLYVASFSERQGYYVPGTGTSWDLFTDGARELGLSSTELPLDESSIRSYLEQGKPIICSMRPGDFTTQGHLVVLSGMDAYGNITVNDPNSPKRSSQSWSFETLQPQIRNLWGFTIL